MSIVSQLKQNVSAVLLDLYGVTMAPSELTINTTKPEFIGDYTLVLFSFVKQIKKSPDALGTEIGNALVQKAPELVREFNIIKGFLNLVVQDNYWIDFLSEASRQSGFGQQGSTGKRVIVEYSSPNTNKPLHLGHLRNNFLGWSVAQLLKQTGNDVIKTAIMNDRGIHICKSMIAWQLFGHGKTPESTGMKGDHFVGDYYVLFGEEYKKQVAKLVGQGLSTEAAEKTAPIMVATQQMLLDWENDVPEVRALWQKMNSWVYEGFNETYKKIGSDFDKNYFESEIYLLGKGFVEEGLQKGVFFKKDDGSVWVDLTPEGLDEKLVLRKDGTSVYITQDLGLADKKYEDFHYDQSIYVIADEQNYHMKVLKLILKKLDKPYADGIYHLSYGLVELPSGRMKTREGTVVDADDLLEELKKVARLKTEELGKVKDFNPGELNELYDMLALGALKFFLLRVDPKKRMVFNPEESIDFHGFTGPFVQYMHARIQSILRKEQPAYSTLSGETLLPKEKELIVLLEQFPTTVQQAASDHDPALMATYVYTIARTFSSFYTELSVLSAETPAKKDLRLQLCVLTIKVIASSMSLLGIKVPERM